jgi:hypothetical protein
VNPRGMVLLGCLSLVTGRLAAQRLQEQWAKIVSCPAADSLLGSLRGDWDARVHGFYDERGDSTLLWSGMPLITEDSWSVTAVVEFRGRAPWDYPTAALALALRGDRWRTMLASATIPDAVIVLDDSLRLRMGAPVRGEYTGSELIRVAPITVGLSTLQFAGLVRAKKIRIELGKEQLLLNAQERRDLRGLYRLAACHVPIVFDRDVTELR